jgi:hypothetical protein
MDNLRGLAQITHSGTIYHWGPAFDNWNADRRLRMVRGAADADACVEGIAREIKHYNNGRLVAIASPSGGVRLVD